MKTFVKLIVSLSLLVASIHILDTDSILHFLSTISIEIFILSIGINLVVFLITGIRWYKLLSTKISSNIILQLSLYFKATFFNTFTPANLGGDTYRFLAIKTHDTPKIELFFLLLRERIIGLYGYIITFIASYSTFLIINEGSLSNRYNPFNYALAILGILLILPMVSFVNVRSIPKLFTTIIRKYELSFVRNIMKVSRRLLSTKGTSSMFFLTLLGISLWIISIQVLATGFGLNTTVLQLTIVATLVELIRLIPITIQGIGLRESLFAYLLSFFGHNPELSFVIGCSVYLSLSSSIILCGPVGFVLKCFDKDSVK